MVRLHSTRSVGMPAGHRASPSESGMSRVTDHLEIPRSPGIPGIVKAALHRMLQASRRNLLGQLQTMVMSADPTTGLQETTDGLADETVAGEAAMIRILGINRQLQQVENALHRIGKDDFGSCVYCRALIEQTRLDDCPTVRSCQRCQDRLMLPVLSSGGQ